MTINKSIAYNLLLQSSTMQHLGLMGGKAGIAMSLCEYGNSCHDAYIEEQSLIMLREALLYNKQKISLQEGLSGIGLSLLYLIKKGLVQADFHELFHHQHKFIIDTVGLSSCSSEKKQYLYPVLHYLYVYQQLYHDRTITPYIDSICSSLEDSLYYMLKPENYTVFSSRHIINLFCLYLQLSNMYKQKKPQDIILKEYIRLYTSGFIANHPIVGLLLMGSIKTFGLDSFTDIAQKNIRSIPPYHIQFLNLSACIDISYLLHIYAPEEIGLLKQTEQHLLNIRNIDCLNVFCVSAIPSTSLRMSYQHGLARLLLYRMCMKGDKKEWNNYLFL